MQPATKPLWRTKLAQASQQPLTASRNEIRGGRAKRLDRLVGAPGLEPGTR